jgi:hypothetical protein
MGLKPAAVVLDEGGSAATHDDWQLANWELQLIIHAVAIDDCANRTFASAQVEIRSHSSAEATPNIMMRCIIFLRLRNFTN